MYYYQSAFYGMHFFWWCFWIVLWVSFFTLLTPTPRRRWQRTSDSPKDILVRRLASGEINEQEFESRKSIIEKEYRQNSSGTKEDSSLKAQGV